MDSEDTFTPRTSDENPTRSMSIDELSTVTIGRYRLLQKIGEGGMGEVWLAEQTDSLRRRVALKLIRAGMNSREVVARFESERQVLALMDHPAIAKVFDAGETPDGAPYFVMEYVAGSPITTCCDELRLSTRERLNLFVRVCEGVQHAHQKAVIHRDLKPTNILVKEMDGHLVPKIIDFGVAKALSQKLTPDTLFTRMGALIGTPEYMSPEQALFSGAEIDTRTDVYSLGIILYELLAGAPPLNPQKINFDEFLRRLRHEEPKKPSTAISTQDEETSADVATKRRTVPRTLAKEIRGDLDTIVLKAIQREPARRYRSVEQMSEDVRRHLENRPVVARPDTLAYRFSRFALRNRWGIAAAAAVIVSLTAGTLVALHQASVARQRFDQVRKLARSFIEMNDDVARLPGSTAVREKLVATALNYLGNLASNAGNDAGLLDEVGQAYGKVGEAQGAPGTPSLGKTKDALASFRKAVAFEERAAAINPSFLANVADLESKLAYLEMLSGDLPQARLDVKAAEALVERLRVRQPGDTRILALAAGVAVNEGDLVEYEGHTADGLHYYQQAKTTLEEYCRNKPDTYGRARLNLVSTLVAEGLAENGRYREALDVLHKSDTIIDGLLAEDPENPKYIRQKMAAANTEGLIYYAEGGHCLGKPVESAAAARRYLALAQRLVDADSHNASARLSRAVANFQLSYPLGEIDPVESLMKAKQAVRLLDEELVHSPHDYLLRSRRARALRYLSYAYSRNRLPADAQHAIAQAIAIQQQLLRESPSDASEREQVQLSQKVLAELR